MSARSHLASSPVQHCIVLLTFSLALSACSQNTSPREAINGPSDSSGGGSSSAGGSGGAPSGGAPSTGSGTGGGSVIIVKTSDAGTSNTLADAALERCDEAGLNCKCIAIANIGAVGSSGTTLSYDTWLNTRSNARVDNYPRQVTIDASFLAKYDELIFQDISTWTITAQEVSTITAWVQAGGGLMSMNGYEGSETESTEINLILAPLGFAYSKTPKGGGVLWQIVNGWIPASPIAANMNGLGVNVHNGRDVVDLNLGAQTDTALLAIAQANNGMTYNLGYTNTVGSGHVFPWSDEWVTYTSDWDDETGTLNVEQFWYNSITYLTPTNACKVVINDPHVVVK
jgi:hypothetical protein